ncbi:hypothetical protein ELH75_36055 [Rhizobium leguminosarum]|nr:hypothetical protein ELH75_36055 [Rhizobium leguminosarum]
MTRRQRPCAQSGLSGIQTSSGEVATGVDLVSKTGEALTQIGALVVAMNQPVDAIAMSSREQSVGLAEIPLCTN